MKYALLAMVIVAISIALMTFAFSKDKSKIEDTNMYKKLTPEEERIIVQKGTEKPFTGKYNNFHEKGVYICKRCGFPLFESYSKFKSECGWPSFDQEIPGAIISKRDADDARTENLCANCGAHLGHVFKGEGYTEKNIRFCVNSISMDFIPNGQRAIFAGGCFWGVEYHFKKIPGVISVTSGFIGGKTERPTYEQVCSGKTGHAEAVVIAFDPNMPNYETLAKIFFEIHDFTQLNRQGPDVGEQYRSEIFYLNDEQNKTAEKLIKILKDKGYDVKTAIAPASAFWPAEQYHQDYYQKTGKTPYCHIYKKIF